MFSSTLECYKFYDNVISINCIYKHIIEYIDISYIIEFFIFVFKTNDNFISEFMYNILLKRYYLLVNWLLNVVFVKNTIFILKGFGVTWL